MPIGSDWICWVVSRVHQASNPPWVQRVQKKRPMIRRLVLSGGGKTNPTSHLFGESTNFFDGRENRKANSCLLIAIDMG